MRQTKQIRKSRMSRILTMKQEKVLLGDLKGAKDQDLQGSQLHFFIPHQTRIETTSWMNEWNSNA